MNKNVRIKEKKQTKESVFKSKLEQMGIAYSNNGAEKLYQEVNSTRKGFELQTLLMEIIR
jgi:hypothetical protein